MKGHVRRAIQVAETLDFRIDEDASHHGTRVYWHPNAPEERIKLFSGASEPACIAFIRKANQIAETGWSGPTMPRTIAERVRTRQAEDRLKRQRAKAESDRRVNAVIEVENSERRRMELHSISYLMGAGRPRCF